MRAETQQKPRGEPSAGRAEHRLRVVRPESEPRRFDLPTRGRYFQARRDPNGDPVVEGGSPIEGVDLSQDPTTGRIKVAIRFRPYAGIPRGRDGLPGLPESVRRAIARLADRGEGRPLGSIVETPATRELLREPDGRVVEIDPDRLVDLRRAIARAERVLADRKAEVRRGDWYEPKILDEIRAIEDAKARALADAEARNSLTLGELAKRFLEGYEGRAGTKPPSDYYENEVPYVVREIGSARRIQDITREVVEAFRDGMKSAGLSSSTIRKRVRIVGTMLRFAVDRKLLPAMPYERIKLPLEPPPKESRFSRERWAKLLEASDVFERDFFVVAKAIFARFQEPCFLQIPDVDFENRRVRVERRKTGKVSKVAFGYFDAADDVEAVFRRLVDEAKARGGTFLLVDSAGQPFSTTDRRNYLDKRLNHRIESCGFNVPTWSADGMSDEQIAARLRSERLTFHSVRATGISENLERGKRPAPLAKAAGVGLDLLFERYARDLGDDE